MRSFVVLILLFSSVTVLAKDKPKYIVAEIPQELRQNADAVFWEDRSSFQILTKSRANYKVFRAVTIMNANGKRHTDVIVTYDKLSKVVSIKGTIYNANGEVIRRTKSNEIYDQSLTEGALFSDNRLKHIGLTHGAYPYTIEYEYEVEYKYLFVIPPYVQYVDEKVSLMKSEFSLLYQKDLKPRYRTTLIDKAPEVVDLGNNTESLTWSFENLKPIRMEPYGPGFSDVVPSIHVAPSTFEFDGYSGKMDSWDEFGQWVGKLNNGRNTLSEATREKIKTMTANLPSTEAKVKALYEYMQSKTRYVSIQLGIGGYQPFEAAVVDQTGYGDCKALSNYMVSMLDVIGIKSHYVLVNSGFRPSRLWGDFPSAQFDHAIVCVPMEADTIWLECTSQTIPFAYMGSHTGNRQALALTPAGAKIVSTPKYTERENQQIRNARIRVDDHGNAIAHVKTTYQGLQYENHGLDAILGDTYDNQKKWVQNTTAIPSFDLNKFTFVNDKQRIPAAVVSLDLTLNRFATVSGKRLFLSPNIMNKSTIIPEKNDNRKSSIVLYPAFTDVDSISIEISEKLYPEFIPEPVTIESVFGRYESKFILDQGQVVYIRKFVRNSGEFSADTYQDFVDFYKNINKADNIKMVFVNKT